MGLLSRFIVWYLIYLADEYSPEAVSIVGVVLVLDCAKDVSELKTTKSYDARAVILSHEFEVSTLFPSAVDEKDRCCDFLFFDKREKRRVEAFGRYCVLDVDFRIFENAYDVVGVCHFFPPYFYDRTWSRSDNVLV